MTRLYYAELLGRFDAELQKYRPHLAKKNVLFHQDNAPAHNSAELADKLLPHPPYSQDLATCDCLLLPNLRNSHTGQKYESNEEVIPATEIYLVYRKRIFRWVKCIQLK